MTLLCCTIWRMGVVESTQHEGEASVFAQEAKMLADPGPGTSVPASALAGAGQEPPSAPARGGGSPVNLKRKQPLRGGRPSLRRRRFLCTKQLSVLTRRGAEVPVVPCLPAAVNQHLPAC